MIARLARALLAAGCLVGSASALAAPPGPSDAAAALDRLRVDHPALKATHRPGSPVPTVLSGLAVPTEGADAAARVEGFLAGHRALFAGAELRVDTVRPRPARTLVALTQTHDGLPVLDRGASVTLDADGRVVRVSGHVRPLTHVDRATIDPEAARALAVRHITGASMAEPLPQIALRVDRGVVAVGSRGTEVYEVHVSRRPLAEHLIVRIDAHAGRVLGVRNGMVH